MPDTPDAPDPKSRFSDRVDAYVKHRPTYPPVVLDFLRDTGFLRDAMTVADIGSGTGISSALFVRGGYQVIGVEPNAAMRSAAEQMLAGERNFTSVAGSAEATTLADASVDLVVAGQAFHWFDRKAFAAECRRILRPGPAGTPGGVSLFWNSRKLTGSPFAEQYEALLNTFGTDYARVRHDAITDTEIADFYAPQSVRTARFPLSQKFDYAGLEGRLLSSSYTPPAGDLRRTDVLAALREIFDRCQVDGHVLMEYWTEVHVGRL
ncbi:class I SAM-dependent methyltransferase [Humisphaera borealis]|uniref:Class I SAM-dependent methyltransferase n=1 Tax=Humisphaera borealis TaxID=2807512 RepID=A0A7M2WQ07_9BACT|nr:class I SAM-dependent methyltransferase [Humisphaera borealis]QOV87493.1 class I SAM-dependent methyltransferase [Humisphaera borealis]